MQHPLVAVGAVIFDKDRRVLLVKRKNPPNKGSWAIPGGKVKYGETLEEAIKREMKEETNLDIKVKEPLAIVEIIKEGFHYVIIDFICEIVEGQIKPGSDAEDVKFFSLEEVKRLNTSHTTVEMLIRYFKGEKTPLMIVERPTQISK